MATINNIFHGSMEPRNITKFMLSRGVVDYSNLTQFNNYESGYGFLFVLQIPKFLEELASSKNSKYADLIHNYAHILEYDFRSLDGFEDYQSDNSDLNDGINSINIITKTTMQSASSFSMRFYERSGSPITKVHELFLRGIKDPRTQVKRYNGLLETGETGRNQSFKAGYENEVFSFLYINTDNTVRFIEKAYLIVAAQPTSAELSIYNYEKGSIEWKELNVTFSGYPITGPAINEKGQEFLDWLNESTVFEESRFGYDAIMGNIDSNNKMKDPGSHYGGTSSTASSQVLEDYTD